jgi:hypothetical protein
MNMGAPGGLNASFTSMMDPSGGGVPSMGGTSIIPQGTDISQMGLDVGGQQQAQEQVEQDEQTQVIDEQTTKLLEALETGDFNAILQALGFDMDLSGVASDEDDFATKVKKEKDVLAQVLGIDDDEGKMRPEMADFLMALGASLMSNKSGSGMSGAFSALGEAGMKALPTLTAGRREEKALEKQIALAAYSTVSAREAARADFARQIQLKELEKPPSYREWLLTDQSIPYGEFAQKRGGTTIDMRKRADQAMMDYDIAGLTEDRAAVTAGKEVNRKLEIMDQILSNPDVETGRLAEAMMPIKQWMRDMDLISEEEKNKLSNQEMFNAASSYAVPRMRAVGSGATSDFEAKLYQSAIANMEYGPQTNRYIIKTMVASYEKDKKLLKMKEAYLRDPNLGNGTLAGWLDYLDEEITVDGVTQSREAHEAPLFKVFTMEEVKDGKTDLDIAFEKRKIKKGDLYLDEKSNRLEIYGFEVPTYNITFS